VFPNITPIERTNKYYYFCVILIILKSYNQKRKKIAIRVAKIGHDMADGKARL